jgi:hypothetical protein
MKCRHIYEIIKAEICPDCGRDTHETDFLEQTRLHEKWIEEGNADWSKCPQGGTLRGWWSI